MPEPLSLFGPGVTVLRWAWNAIGDLAGFGSSPRLVLDLANPVDQAREPWFEWLHLEVRNQPRRFARRTRPALGVALRAIVDEQQPGYTLVWSGSTPGNLIMHCDVHVNFGRRVPLIFRAASGAKGAQVFNTYATPDVCYLSEIEFVTQGIASVPLDPGEHTLDVLVQHGDGEQLKPKRYLLTVSPADSPLRINLRG